MKSEQTTSSRKGEERRLLILDTTLKMISVGGVDSITHRRVAQAADVPLGSTTYYFKSREDLLRSAFTRYIDETRAALDELSRTWGPIATAKGLVDYLVKWVAREFEDEGMLLTEYEMVLFAARDSLVAKSLHEWDDAMAKGLAKTLSDIGVPRSSSAARIVLHVVRGYELDRLSHHEAKPADLRRTLQHLIAGLKDV